MSGIQKGDYVMTVDQREVCGTDGITLDKKYLVIEVQHRWEDRVIFIDDDGDKRSRQLDRYQRVCAVTEQGVDEYDEIMKGQKAWRAINRSK